MNLCFIFSVLNKIKLKCGECCNNIHDPYAKLRVPDVLKNINVKVSNLMS